MITRIGARYLMTTRVAVFALLVAIFATTSAAVTITTVPVGDAGNANDLATGRGAVSYGYSIGKYEVTVEQYTAFLNAVGATDTFGLYSPSMTSDLNIAGIARGGASGSYSYSVIGSVNHPVSYMSWGNAARFANWLHNGQPVGVEGPGTTETGAYTLNGATTPAALSAVIRNSDATWFIPNENEWYKAAYYQPAANGGDLDGYWAYPMRTNIPPYSDQPPGATPDNTRVGNFYATAIRPSGAYNLGFAVTGSTTYSSTQNYLTDVGAYSSSASYYGTFDQGGNMFEWMETPYVGGYRILRGGYWGTEPAGYLDASSWTYGTPSLEFNSRGFRVARVAAIPEPTSISISLVSSVMLLIGRRRRPPI